MDFLRIANCTNRNIYCPGIISFENSLGGYAIEGGGLVTYFCVEIGPELDKEESVLRALAVQHLQSVVLFRELVLDLPHVHRLGGRKGLIRPQSFFVATAAFPESFQLLKKAHLKTRVRVVNLAAYVDEEMLVVGVM